MNTPAVNGENFRAWQQLANEGIITGHYSGVRTPISFNLSNYCTSSPGTNIPTGSLTNTGFLLQSLPAQVYSDPWWYPQLYGNMMVYGYINDWGNPVPILTSSEAKNIDAKMDDGRPAQGNIMTFKPAADPGCASDDTTAASYTGRGGAVCRLLFLVP